MNLTFPFGKYKGKPISHADTDYLCWLYGQSWFRTKYRQLRWSVARQLIRRLQDELPSPPMGTSVIIMSAAEFAASDGMDLV